MSLAALIGGDRRVIDAHDRAVQRTLGWVEKNALQTRVIAGQKPGHTLTDVYGQWDRIRTRAGLKDVRVHDLRHSYASGGLLVGEGLTMIGKLLGHNKVETTSRYAHLANDPLKAAANRIATRIAKVAG